MNKELLAKAVASRLEVTIKDAKVIVDAVFEAVLEGITEHDEVSLGALGKLTKVERAARVGRNPQTGEELQIEGKTAPKFKASKILKDSVK